MAINLLCNKCGNAILRDENGTYISSWSIKITQGLGGGAYLGELCGDCANKMITTMGLDMESPVQEPTQIH
jgi:hypothetical protein